jgi:hypothetical protein
MNDREPPITYPKTAAMFRNTTPTARHISLRLRCLSVTPAGSLGLTTQNTGHWIIQIRAENEQDGISRSAGINFVGKVLLTYEPVVGDCRLQLLRYLSPAYLGSWKLPGYFSLFCLRALSYRYYFIDNFDSVAEKLHSKLTAKLSHTNLRDERHPERRFSGNHRSLQ